MLKLFIAAFSVGLLYWLWNKKSQIFASRNNKVDPFITTIEAIELQTFLAWDTPRSCLESDGIRYGKQFKLKKPPNLHRSVSALATRIFGMGVNQESLKLWRRLLEN